MSQHFDLQGWLKLHEGDGARNLENALRGVPREQRTLALLSWLSAGNLHGRRIQVPLS